MHYVGLARTLCVSSATSHIRRPTVRYSFPEFWGEFYEPSETTKLYKMYNVNHTGVVRGCSLGGCHPLWRLLTNTVPQTTVYGINKPAAAVGAESTLDVEWITAGPCLRRVQ